ncbi:hypothetical protein GCM10023200_09570 [Actinomycetospora chlora]|uniref:Uncharacterized protein n=1 Tax=Actinomycetospora chlora TaxID=663608 RepID=A0ABP9ACM6_9PSEU
MNDGNGGRRDGRVIALLGLLVAIVAAAAAVLVIPSDNFQSLMASSFDQEVNTQQDLDRFVTTIVARQDSPFLERVLGRRVELETSFDGRLGAFRVNAPDVTGDPVLDRTGPLPDFRIPTTQCPGSEGRLVPLYVFLRGDVDSGRFAWFPGRSRAALNGFWDVDRVRSQTDGSFCTVDLRLHAD